MIDSNSSGDVNDDNKLPIDYLNFSFLGLVIQGFRTHWVLKGILESGIVLVPSTSTSTAHPPPQLRYLYAIQSPNLWRTTNTQKTTKPECPHHLKLLRTLPPLFPTMKIPSSPSSSNSVGDSDFIDDTQTNNQDLLDNNHTYEPSLARSMKRTIDRLPKNSNSKKRKEKEKEHKKMG